MRFVKIDDRYINLDHIQEVCVVPATEYDPVLEVRLWRAGDDYASLRGEHAQRFLDALDKMDGIYAA